MLQIDLNSFFTQLLNNGWQFMAIPVPIVAGLEIPLGIVILTAFVVSGLGAGAAARSRT
jgi:hypothetical protein